MDELSILGAPSPLMFTGKHFCSREFADATGQINSIHGHNFFSMFTIP